MTPTKISESRTNNSAGAAPETAQNGEKCNRVAPLSLATLGIVFGDIGTSPLYAFRQSIYGEGPILIAESDVLGILSLIFWALIIVISVKYMIFMLRTARVGFWPCWRSCACGRIPRF